MRDSRAIIDNLGKLIFYCHSEEIATLESPQHVTHANTSAGRHLNYLTKLKKHTCLVQGDCDGRFTPSQLLVKEML